MESREQIDIRELCELCKSMPCCPEHCCNWDQCKCNDCEYCRGNQHKLNQDNFTDPSILIKSTGQEETIKVKQTKKNKNQAVEGEDDEEEEKSKIIMKPSVQTRAQDGALIINYEIPLEDEEDKVVYAGGIKGIRALRQQRDNIYEQISEDLQENKSKFSQFEESKR